MNVTESAHVQHLIRWVTDLTLWEGLNTIQDNELVSSVAFLTERAQKTLGAGPTNDDVMRDLARVLDRRYDRPTITTHLPPGGPL